MTDKKIKEWNDFLKKQYNMPDNFKLVSDNKSSEDIWRIAAILLGVMFILEIAGAGVYFGYLGYTGKLKQDTFINNTNNIDTPDIPITNQYTHNIPVSVNVSCIFPDELNLVIKNETS